MIRIAVLMADKTEDIEAIVPIDLWKRAGFNVVTLSVEKKKNITLASGTKISCNEVLTMENFSKFNAVYLPGGPGYKKFNDVDAPKLINFIVKNANNQKITFMSICAATAVYGGLGVLANVKATCYPGFQDSFKKTYVDKDVVCDKNFITGKGPGSAYKLALVAIAKLTNLKTAKEIAKQTCYAHEIGVK